MSAVHGCSTGKPRAFAQTTISFPAEPCVEWHEEKGLPFVWGCAQTKEATSWHLLEFTL